VTIAASNEGVTTFSFPVGTTAKTSPPVDAPFEMTLQGSFLSILGSVLPHEITHTVLATHFGKQLPRWADEGIAVLHESIEEQAQHDIRARELLNAGRGIRLKTLLRMTEFPKDTMVLYTQGHSVCRFLLARGKELPKPGPGEHYAALMFLSIGTDGNTAESWDKAARDVYAFKSVDDLEEAWLAWLTKPESRLDGSGTKAPPRPAVKPDLIPPTNLPGGPITVGR
jgi:hypothetical protein